MKLPRFSRSRPTSASTTPVSSPPVASPSARGKDSPSSSWPDEPGKAIHLCLPLSRTLSRRKPFSSEIVEGSSPKSPARWSPSSRRPSLSPTTSSEIVGGSSPKSPARRSPSSRRPSLSPTTSSSFFHVASSSRSSSTSPLVLKKNVGGSLRHVSPRIMMEMEQVFAQFDSNKDGRISAQELCCVLRSLGDNTTEAEAHLMVAEADSDGDGFISLQEFIDLNIKGSHSSGGVASDDELSATFNIFDLDKNGHITAEELHSVLTKLGDSRSTLEDCRRMIRGVDRKGTGHVDFDDFKLMMTSA